MSLPDNSMPEELLQMMADRFKALAEPARLQLLDRLRGGESSVGELASATGLHPANVSKHLQLLFQLGFVERRKEGLFVYYSLTDQRFERLGTIICNKLGEEAEAQRRALGT